MLDSIIADLQQFISATDVDSPLPKRLFKVRVSDNPAAHIGNRNEMFHIPLHLRHLVRSNRFSIPGIPCLCLGSSIYDCWEEMGRPAFHKLSFSRFEPTNEYCQQKVLTIFSAPLNIQYSYQNSISPITDAHIQIFGQYLKIYPLQLACSIPCPYPDAPYKEEYIIPQLLMQWSHITGQFQGVMYRSVRVPQNGTDSRLLINFAFPVQSLNKTYCPRLVKTFNFTDPVPFEISLASRISNVNPLAHGHTGTLVSGIELPYWQTSFPVYYGPNTLINYSATDFYTAEVHSAYYAATPLQ